MPWHSISLTVNLVAVPLITQNCRLRRQPSLPRGRFGFGFKVPLSPCLSGDFGC
jgi:hypothetical protein